jgi:hypothetical protein
MTHGEESPSEEVLSWLAMDDIVDVDEFQHAQPLKRSRVEDDHDDEDNNNEKQEGTPPPEGYQRVGPLTFCL